MGMTCGEATMRLLARYGVTTDLRCSRGRDLGAVSSVPA